MKRGSTSLFIRDIQMKTTLRYRSTPAEWLKLTTGCTLCGCRCGAIRTLVCGWWAYKWVSTLNRNVWKSLLFPNICWSFDPHFLSCSIPKRNECVCYRNTRGLSRCCCSSHKKPVTETSSIAREEALIPCCSPGHGRSVSAHPLTH